MTTSVISATISPQSNQHTITTFASSKRDLAHNIITPTPNALLVKAH